MQQNKVYFIVVVWTGFLWCLVQVLSQLSRLADPQRNTLLLPLLLPAIRSMDGYIVCCVFFVSGNRYLGGSVTDCSKIMHGDIYSGTPKSPKIRNFDHFTVNSSTTVSRLPQRQLEISLSSTEAF